MVVLVYIRTGAENWEDRGFYILCRVGPYTLYPRYCSLNMAGDCHLQSLKLGPGPPIVLLRKYLNSESQLDQNAKSSPKSLSRHSHTVLPPEVAVLFVVRPSMRR